MDDRLKSQATHASGGRVYGSPQRVHEQGCFRLFFFAISCYLLVQGKRFQKGYVQVCSSQFRVCRDVILQKDRRLVNRRMTEDDFAAWNQFDRETSSRLQFLKPLQVHADLISNR